MCSNIRKARSLAVKYNRDIMVAYNIDGRTYTIDNNAPVPLAEGITFGHGNASATAEETGNQIPSDGVSFADNKETINTQGLSTPGYVYLQNSKGFRKDCFKTVGTVRVEITALCARGF